LGVQVSLPSQNKPMQRLVLFKIIDDKLEFVGYFDGQEMIAEYLSQIQDMIDKQFRTNLKGQYLALPALFYELKQTEIVKPQTKK
tara:strand:- start:24 stop:278 length:255 start_codon:yes stop_codon:yes gene_type:complete